MMSGDPGMEAFVISSNWVKQYLKFIMYDAFKRDYSEEQVKDNMSEDQFENKHPGAIMNYVDLCEEDQNQCNLYGTGSLKGCPSEYIDTYLDTNKRAGIDNDYVCIHTELWNFLFERYGG